MPKGVIFSTLTKMLSPFMDDFIFMLLNDTLDAFFSSNVQISRAGFASAEVRVRRLAESVRLRIQGT
jgi:hypothetical protein